MSLVDCMGVLVIWVVLSVLNYIVVSLGDFGLSLKNALIPIKAIDPPALKHSQSTQSIALGC